MHLFQPGAPGTAFPLSDAHAPPPPHLLTASARPAGELCFPKPQSKSGELLLRNDTPAQEDSQVLDPLCSSQQREVAPELA